MKLVWEYIKYRRFFALLLILLDAEQLLLKLGPVGRLP